MDRKLRKSNTDRMLAGVCGGVANFCGIDSTLVRIACAVAICCGGTGLWLYIICALIIPQDDVYGSGTSHNGSWNNGHNGQGPDDNGWH